MNIVRGAGNIAGNIVDGTVNAVATVASVATGGLGGGSGSGSIVKRHSLDGKPSVVLKDKVTLTLKVRAMYVNNIAMFRGEPCRSNRSPAIRVMYTHNFEMLCIYVLLFNYTVDSGAVGSEHGYAGAEEREHAQAQRAGCVAEAVLLPRSSPLPLLLRRGHGQGPPRSDRYGVPY